MSHAANRTWIGNTPISMPPSAYSQSSWLASAELGVNLPVVAKTAHINKVSGRRYIYLEPLVRVPSRDDPSEIDGESESTPRDVGKT